jgi:predicted dehydrogenase
MSKQYRTAVIGVGFGKRVHVPAWRCDPRCEVVAIAATSEDRARQAADELQIPDAYSDWQQMLRRDDIDAVSIAVPPDMQAEIALSALRCEKSVLCEKPLSTSLIDAGALTEAAFRSGKAHLINFEIPQAPSWQKAKQLLDENQIGPLCHINVNWHVVSNANASNLNSWKANADMGGGALNGFASHVLHYLEWFGGKISRMCVQLHEDEERHSDCDTLVRMWINFASRATASVTVNTMAGFGNVHRVELHGTECALQLVNDSRDYISGFKLLRGGPQDSSMTEVSCDAPGSTDLADAPDADGRIGATAAMMKRLIDWVETGVEQHPNFEDGLRVQRLIDESRQSHRHESWVDVAR